MGLLSNIAGRIERAFSSDRDHVIIRAAQGSTGPTGPSNFNLLQSYGYDAIAEHLRMDAGLLESFIDYEEMADYPYLAVALDIFADDVTQPDTVTNRTVWASSKNVRVRAELDAMIRRCQLDEDSWEITRTLCMYGNDYEEILVGDDGVIGLNHLPPPTMRRIEGHYGECYGFIQDPRGKVGYSLDEFNAARARREALMGGQPRTGDPGLDPAVAFEEWEVAHFRLRGKRRRSVYGSSILEPARWIWRRLMLLEDAAMIYRLHRAPERFAFYVNVGDRSDQEAQLFVNRMRQRFKKTRYVNPRTGQLDLKASPPGQDEDFYLPFRSGEEGSRVEMLSAPAWQHMDDVEYFRNILFAAIKIPRAYMGDEEGAVRSVLSSQDIRFARTVLRIQREVRHGFKKIARVHLAALNIDPNLVDFDINMTVPSSLLELAQIEARAARADLAARTKDFVSLHWVLSHVFNMGDDEIQRIFMQRDEDVLREGKAQATAQGMMQPDMGGGLEDMGGMDAMGLPPEGGAVPSEGSPAAPPEPGPFERRGSYARALNSSRERRFPSGRVVRGGVKGLSERELFAGSHRETEKRMMGKLEELRKSDQHFGAQLDRMGDLIADLRAAVTSSRR